MSRVYDERQQWYNNKFSRQALALIMVLLLLSAIISTYISIWAERMIESLVIIAITVGYYVTRSVLNDAYIGKKDSLRKNIIIFGVMGFLFIVLFFSGYIGPMSRKIIVDGKVTDDFVMLLSGVLFLYITVIHIIKATLLRHE